MDQWRDRTLTPSGMATLESTAQHLHLSLRQTYALLATTPLRQVGRLALGRSRGSYRLIPQLGIAALRQRLVTPTWHLDAWDAALNDLLRATAWHEALHTLSVLSDWRTPTTSDEAGAANGMDQSDADERHEARGAALVERLLLSPAAHHTAAMLLSTSFAALDRHGLDGSVQFEPMVVDRLEDEVDAVILVGRELRAYLLPRALLRLAHLDHEKAYGILMATRTSTGVAMDVWPAVGVAPARGWQADALLLEQLVDVGREPEAAAGTTA